MLYGPKKSGTRSGNGEANVHRNTSRGKHLAMVGDKSKLRNVCYFFTNRCVIRLAGVVIRDVNSAINKTSDAAADNGNRFSFSVGPVE